MFLLGPDSPDGLAARRHGARHCARARAKLLKRVFELDLEHYPNCGGELKIIAAILEQPVIEKILTHLGLQADCGRRSAPARGPAPQEEFALASANAACKAVHHLGRQPAARRSRRPEHKSNTVDSAARRHGLLDSAASGVSGTAHSDPRIRVHP